MTFKKLIVYLLQKTGHYYSYLYVLGRKTKNQFLSIQYIKKVFFLMTPTYGNLGDQAIEIASEKMIHDYFPDYLIVPIHLEDTCQAIKGIEKSLSNNDFIVLQGGGNFGNLYLSCEIIRRLVVSKLRKNAIISMPSTITYENTREGKKCLRQSKKIYNHNPNFFILARDQHSFRFAKSNFRNCHIFLSPDSVFYLDFPIQRKRFGIQVCLRKDKESILGSKRDVLIKQMFKKYDDITIFDTQLYRDISDNMRKEEVVSALTQISKAEVFLTDRLHGMIFAYLCGTPCVVLPSSDKKIYGSYENIKDCGFIKLLTSDAPNIVLSEIEKIRNTNIKYINFKNTFDQVFAMIKEII